MIFYFEAKNKFFFTQSKYNVIDFINRIFCIVSFFVYERKKIKYLNLPMYK